MGLTKICEDYGEFTVFFLHLLVMTPTLLGLSSPDELLHRLENLVCPAHVAVHEVLVVELQEPVILFVFL